MTHRIKQIIYTAILMIIGSILFKTIPMDIFGPNILFDASRHIMVACFVLYILFLFIKDKSWRIPYFILSFAVLMIISIQRIISNAHNDIGLLMGFVLSLIAIIIPRWGEVKKHLSKIK
jgi:membrane-associated phospholipid phosphatase